MSNKIIYISKEEYNKLTTRERIERTNRLVNMLVTLNNGTNPTMEEFIRLKLDKYLFNADFAYMTPDEIELFHSYGYGVN